MLTAALITHTLITAFVVAFQICVALGAPWGQYTMGGKYSGVLPNKVRVAILAQSILLIVLNLSLHIKSDNLLPQYLNAAEFMSWVAVVFAAMAVLLNAITPSAKERNLWLPITVMMLVCVLAITIN